MEVLDRSVPLEILIVEDEPDIADTIAEVLRTEGHRPTVIGNGDVAMRRLSERIVDLLICDVRLPGTDGLTILERIKQLRPETPVILMSAYGSIAEAVDAVRHDAFHYLAKPFGMDELLEAVHEIGLQVAGSNRIIAVQVGEEQDGPDAAIIGDSPAIVAMREFIRTVADAPGPVLITGETGTGKELIAQTLHRLSPRRNGPFVAVNCASFPETLLEAELFGHERGAFTGAMHAREGRFRAADGGTLFLDEVGEIAVASQAKLLRVLESGTFQPLGSDETCHVDVRVVSATNADLRGADRHFRDDLFYRLKMFHVHVPPLRDRRSDLPALVEHFLAILADDDPPRLTPRAWAALSHHDYPGNVRELRHALGHALAIARGDDIDVKHLPAELRGDTVAPSSGESPGIQQLRDAEREFQRDYLLRTLRATEWNKTRAAELLGISRKTLWKKLRDLGIDGSGTS